MAPRRALQFLAPALLLVALAAPVAGARGHSYGPRTSYRPIPHYYSPRAIAGVPREAHGRIERSESEKHEFMKESGYPHGRPGYIVDHIIPLARGGPDTPGNMQWQTKQEARAKDKVELGPRSSGSHHRPY